MKKILVLGIAYMMFGFSSGGTTVYICTGKYAKKYHFLNDCRGLNNCKGDVLKTTLDQATFGGMTLCGFED